MKEFLWIPAAGTIAGLIAILLARGAKEDSVYPLKIEIPKAPQLAERDREPPAPEPPPAPKPDKPKPPVASRYLIEVTADGGLAVTADNRRIDGLTTVETFLAHAAPGDARPLVTLFATSSRITAEDVEKVAAKLRDRCEVVVQKRAGQKDDAEEK
ncbi:MAG: hypothetical protein ACYTGN_04165 [Planctomycetota bacterium]